MVAPCPQHQIGFQSGREYERAAIVKWLNDIPGTAATGLRNASNVASICGRR